MFDLSAKEDEIRPSSVVRVYEFGEIQGRLYIAYELIDGIDLKKLISRMRANEQSFTSTQAAQLCGQVTEALHAAHQAGIVHRDLKPANILMDATGLPHVADFGLAKREAQAEFTMTQNMTLLGTPEYMSPEQWRDSHAVGPASDIYSLGVILYELLTGRVPFPCTTDKWILLRDLVLKEEPIAPRRLNLSLPISLETICLKCLAKDPARRFATALELARELNRFIHGEPVLSRPIGRLERTWRWCRRKPAVASLSAAVVFVLLSGTTVSSFFAFQSATRNRELMTETTRAKLTFESPSSDHIHSVVFSPDGKRLSLGYKGYAGQGEVQVWDAMRGELLLTLKGHSEGDVHSVAFSPDGKQLASASADGTLKFWDVTSGQETRTLKGHNDPVYCVAFSPDGKRLASGSSDRTVRVWDAKSGQETLTLKGHVDPVIRVMFIEDSKRLASIANDGKMIVWDARRRMPE